MPGYSENIEDYEVLELLGKGGFANVYKARCKHNNEIMAIKMIDKKLIHSAGLTNRVRQEVEIHSRLKHPFVVELYTFFQDADYVYLVMELASNGELQKYIKEHLGRPLTENEAAGILQQVVTGILYLHSHRIMHRDISLSNLLLSKNMNVKIADFGLAAQLKQNDEKHLTMCGTPNFISPEVASRSSHGLAADVWAIGCLLYTLLVGRPPFDTHGVQATLTKVVISDYSLPKELSYEAKDLINKLLKKDPNERIALQNIINHPFMCKFNKSFEHGGMHTFSKMMLETMAYNSSNKSCDSGIITFASNNSVANSLRPPTDNRFTQHNSDYTASQLFHNINCQPKNASNDNQWHIQTQSHENPIKENNNFFDNPTQMIAGIPTAMMPVSITHKKEKQQQKQQHLSVPPLNTKRLQPTRFRNKSAVMSILNDGEVVIEFIKFRAKLNEARITDVCWISKDGQRIVIYEPEPGRGLPILEQPPELPQHDMHVEIFNYNNLPQKHWRKYLFASRFVSLVKASTPKVTLYSDQAKFHLMESMLHYEALFYDNSKVTQSPNEGLKIFDRHGRLLQPQEHTSATAIALLEHQAACLRHCETICNTFKMIQNTNGEDIACFPVVIGRRPNRVGKTQEISFNKNLGNFNTFSSTPLAIKNPNILLHYKNQNVQPIRSITIPAIGKATELSNGVLQIEFFDGTSLTITRNGSSRDFTFMQTNGVATHFSPQDNLPLIVREKLVHLPSIEEELKRSKPINLVNGFNETTSGAYFSTPSTTKSAKMFTSTPASYFINDRIENINSPHSSQPMHYFR